MGKKYRKPFAYLFKELEDTEKCLSKTIYKILDKSKLSNVELRIYQASWYIRGLTYHCRNLIEFYINVCKEVASRALTEPDVIVMHAPMVQKLMFEFYALLNLARISLDNLRNILSPIFKTKYEELPKSITDYKKGSTDCPIHEKIANEPMVDYLIDIRNCIVHYRSFATGDNVVIFKKGLEKGFISELKGLFNPIIHSDFRWTNNKKISFNIYLPDVIFERDSSGNKRLAQFTYKKQINLLSQSMHFVRIASCATMEALILLIRTREPKYIYQKK